MHAAISMRQISDAIISLVTALVNRRAERMGFRAFL
jgi:hypothetical protein